jgi:hypothetical protein
MSFWGKISQSWGSGSTIKARDSDDLSGHYDVQDRLRSDYARNFPDINVYASDELRGLSPEMQERLLKLPVERRVDIYKNMEVIFSEDTVDRGWLPQIHEREQWVSGRGGEYGK